MPFLVEDGRNKARKGFRLHVPLLSQLVELVPEHQPLIPAHSTTQAHASNPNPKPSTPHPTPPNRGAQTKPIVNPRDPQRLGVGGEPREADVELVVDLEHPLEVGRDRLELHAEPAVAGDREAVLPHHRHHGAPVVLEDLGSKEPSKTAKSDVATSRKLGFRSSVAGGRD